MCSMSFFSNNATSARFIIGIFLLCAVEIATSDYIYNNDELGKIVDYRHTFDYNSYWLYADEVTTVAYIGYWRLWMNSIPTIYSIDQLPLCYNFTESDTNTNTDIGGSDSDSEDSDEFDGVRRRRRRGDDTQTTDGGDDSTSTSSDDNSDSEMCIDCRNNEEYVKYRSLDGICNDFDIPLMGSIDTRFNRGVPLDYAFAESENDTLLTPNPRDIARDLLHVDESSNGRVEVSSLNLLGVAWIQFMIHDWIDHGINEDLSSNPIKIPLSEDDPLYDSNSDDNYLNVGRTQADPTYGSKNGDEDIPATFLNKITSWWDSNMLYGTDSETNMELRDVNDTSKLRLIYSDKLESSRLDYENNEEITGFTRNWWLGLSLLHTLFALEHNTIVDELYGVYGDLYSSEERYHLARLIVSALIAKIHTIEWTPAMLNSDIPDIKLGMRANWYGIQWNDLGFSENCEKNRISSEQYLLTKQLLDLGSAVKGGKRNWVSKYYQFSEEFVSVYRLHPLVPDNFNFETFDCLFNSTNEFCEKNTIGMENIFGGENTIAIQNEYSHLDLLYSFGAKNSPNALHLNSFSRKMTDLYDPDTGTYIDLATIDLIRQRERGVPRYNEFRISMGLSRVSSFEELISDETIVTKLKKYYNNVDEIDFLIGVYAENEESRHVPNGWIFGETTFAVFLQAATLRLQSDRFFTENYNSDYYTDFGIAWIELNSFKDVLTRHYPDLVDILPKNAFFKWSFDACTECD